MFRHAAKEWDYYNLSNERGYHPRKKQSVLKSSKCVIVIQLQNLLILLQVQSGSNPC